ncbi:MAG: 3'(2'),5'-bisphosphate nucleotidase CysQ [Candidatus Acetothermia bacterium]
MDPQDYLDFVKELTKEAGEKTLEFYRSDYAVNEKAGGSPVTEADLESEEILIDGLSKTEYGIVAEERGRVDRDNSRGYWIVDPLDGTQDFIDKTGEFAIMVGFLQRGEPLLGVVYAPASEKLWYATKGDGAFVVAGGDESSIEVNNKPTLVSCNLIASRNHFSQADREISERLHVAGITRMGSLGIKFSSIAEGRADLTYYTTDRLGIWDACAPQAILEEAGGSVYDTNGRRPHYDLDMMRMLDGIIGLGTSDPDIKDKIVATLSEVGK